MKEQIKVLKERVKQGDFEARYQLAYLYEQGQGVPKDHKLAAHHYELAAKEIIAYIESDVGENNHRAKAPFRKMVACCHELAAGQIIAAMEPESGQGQVVSYYGLQADIKVRELYEEASIYYVTAASNYMSPPLFVNPTKEDREEADFCIERADFCLGLAHSYQTNKAKEQEQPTTDVVVPQPRAVEAAMPAASEHYVLVPEDLLDKMMAKIQENGRRTDLLLRTSAPQIEVGQMQAHLNSICTQHAEARSYFETVRRGLHATCLSNSVAGHGDVALENRGKLGLVGDAVKFVGRVIPGGVPAVLAGNMVTYVAGRKMVKAKQQLPMFGTSDREVSYMSVTVAYSLVCEFFGKCEANPCTLTHRDAKKDLRTLITVLYSKKDAGPGLVDRMLKAVGVEIHTPPLPQELQEEIALAEGSRDALPMPYVGTSKIETQALGTTGASSPILAASPRR
jgi:hypothetical protein